MTTIALMITTFAISLDGFGVGVTYGIRRIRIPFSSIMIIALCSGLVVFCSMHIGVFLLRFISPQTAVNIGALILIGIGLWAMGQFLLQQGNEHLDSRLEKQTSIKFEIKSLGLVIHILRTPTRADMDRSGNISAAEATLLGLALSLDAFGAGVGIGLIGLSPLLTAAIIAMSCGMFIFVGLRLGYMFATVNWVRNLSILPGCMLIIIGLLKLL